MQWIPIIVTVSGVVILALTVILGWIVVPNIIDNQIIEEVQLVNGTETWDKWKDIPLPIYLKFRVFNITNPDEVENGELPILVEAGPYAYREKREKINLFQNPGETDILRYEQKITYYWDKENSCDTCEETDLVNIVNIAFVSVVDGISQISPSLAGFLANSVLGSETLVKRNVKVGDLLFNGFDVRVYTKTLGPLLPEEFSEGRFGLYKGVNESTDGVYEIYTGVKNTADFGKIKTWENQTSLYWWRNDTPCAMINGSDGSVFPPFVEKSWVMQVFVTDLCRSMYLVYEKEIEFMGIKGYRFVVPFEMLEDPRTNPDNVCFCLEDKLSDCPRGGTIHLKGCRGGAPIMMSTPHFLDAWPEYLNDVVMAGPNRDLHQTFIDLEPHTGLNLQASKRIQVNVEIKKIIGVKAMEKLNFKNPFMVFPLVWASEDAQFDEESADDLKGQLLTPLKIVKYSKWSLLGVSCLIIGIGIGIFIYRRRRSTETV